MAPFTRSVSFTQVARDLQIRGDAARAVEGPRGRRGAHEELGEIRRGGVQGRGRRDRHVPVQLDGAVGEAGQQRAVLAADRGQRVLDLQVAGPAPELGRVHEARGRQRSDGDVGRGGDAAAVLQRRDAVVDADVTVEYCGAEAVEVGDQRVAGVALDQQSQEIWSVLPLPRTARREGPGRWSAGTARPPRPRRVDWLPRMASPTSGASRSRFRMIRGVNCSWTKFQICPDSAPGARTR